MNDGLITAIAGFLVVLTLVLTFAAGAALVGWVLMLLLGILGYTVGFFKCWAISACVIFLVRAIFPSKD